MESSVGKTFYGMDNKPSAKPTNVSSKQMLIDTGVADPDKVGIIGGSYGGYMVVAALTVGVDVTLRTGGLCAL